MGEMNFDALCLLAPEDGLSHFNSGVRLVDHWAAKWAHRAMATSTARVYVCRTGGRVAGFYSLSTHAVTRSRDVAGAMRRNAPDPIPATLLGMMGVDTEFQGMGLGASLLRDAVLRAKAASAVVASRALVVDTVDETAAGFYRKFGFQQLNAAGRMFLRL